MSQCNYCNLKNLKRIAKKNNMVIKKLTAKWGLGGVEIFIVPHGITLKEIRLWKQPSDELPNGDKSWKRYHRTWLMKIPDKCCC